MAKRRVEDTLQHDYPSKRCCSPLCNIDAQLDGEAPARGASPPSPLPLLTSRCRKRPNHFEDREKPEEAAPDRKTAHCDAAGTQAVNVKMQNPGSPQDRRSSSTDTSNKKRPREDSVASETVIPKANDKDDRDTNTEDCSYNSFQYWRVPLPELDLSLLEDAGDHSQTKEKSKFRASFSDAMET